MSVIYLPGAMRDLRGIALWYTKHLPEGEARFFARLRETLGRVERAPESFPLAIESLGVRKARVLRSAYAVAYMTRPNEVRLVAVIHGARRPGFWLEPVSEPPTE